jgi:hypothetical protein
MKNLTLSTLLLLGVAACQGGSTEIGSSADRLSAPGGDQCALITNADLLALRAVLVDGLADAEQDVLDNGGEGALGAQNAFTTALAALDDQYAFMQNNIGDSDPDTTNYVEGSLISGAMGEVIADLQEVIHWGAVSEIYYGAPYSRSGVEEALLASELALALQARGVRCYMDNYSAN